MISKAETGIETELGQEYLVKVGRHGQVGRLSCGGMSPGLRRHDHVVCRTSRGVEAGILLGEARQIRQSGLNDGKILRRMAPEDELLWSYLQELGESAQRACEAWINEKHLQAVLLDVEPLLDGKTLYFHFLDEVDSLVQQRLDEMVAVFEEQVSQSEFARLVEQGCGPNCGTDAASGCGSSKGCAVCSIASACTKT